MSERKLTPEELKADIGWLKGRMVCECCSCEETRNIIAELAKVLKLTCQANQAINNVPMINVFMALHLVSSDILSFYNVSKVDETMMKDMQSCLDAYAAWLRSRQDAQAQRPITAPMPSGKPH